MGNNLANASTTGYKATRIAFSSDGPAEGGRFGEAYASTTTETPDLRDGPVVLDGVSTHLALQGSGYFLVREGDQTLFTRDGRFRLDADQRVVDVAGRPVLGMDGPIEVPEGETVRIDDDGKVFGSISGEIAQLRIGDGAADPIGNNLLVPTGAIEPGGARVVQGGLEASNVDAMSAMIDLVQASRYFEAFQKAMQASDELDSRLNQTGGK